MLTCLLHIYKLEAGHSIIIIIKNEKIRVTLCENAAGALYIVNKMCVDGRRNVQGWNKLMIMSVVQTDTQNHTQTDAYKLFTPVWVIIYVLNEIYNFKWASRVN